LVDAKGVEGDGSNGVLKSLKLDVIIEGPYGIPSIDFMSPAYKVYLFISGGIGK
jgi:hypothetical protein